MHTNVCPCCPKTQGIPPNENELGIFCMSAIPVSTSESNIYMNAENNIESTMANGTFF